MKHIINDIAADQDGNIWVATVFGVLRYSGTGWRVFSKHDGLCSYGAIAAEVDKNGRRWFATDDGVSSFDGINWTCYTGDNGLASNGVTSIAVEPDGTLWFGTGEAGVSRLSFE